MPVSAEEAFIDYFPAPVPAGWDATPKSPWPACGRDLGASEPSRPAQRKKRAVRRAMVSRWSRWRLISILPG